MKSRKIISNILTLLAVLFLLYIGICDDRAWGQEPTGPVTYKMTITVTFNSVTIDEAKDIEMATSKWYVNSDEVQFFLQSQQPNPYEYHKHRYDFQNNFNKADSMFKKENNIKEYEIISPFEELKLKVDEYKEQQIELKSSLEELQCLLQSTNRSAK